MCGSKEGMGKPRFCIVAVCVLEILYGLAFMCMGVACSYLSVNTVASSVWQTNGVANPVRMDSTMQTRKDITGQGIWLAILYTVTALCGVVAGQEGDRVFPLVHTVLGLICIAWAPLMWEMLYLLLRPASNFNYSFLYEMDLISTQKHWAAYIVSICVVVAGSALYLFSAALTAYQYGIRMIDRTTNSSVNTQPHHQTNRPNSLENAAKLHSNPTSTSKPQPIQPLHQISEIQTTTQSGESKVLKVTRHAQHQQSSSFTSSLPVQGQISDRTATTSSRSDMDLLPTSPNTTYRSYRPPVPTDFPDRALLTTLPRDRERERVRAVDRERAMDQSNGFGFGQYYEDSQEAVV